MTAHAALSVRDRPVGPFTGDRALARSAVRALHDELRAYPKPGLVSPVDSGAHDDMDFALMCRSADVLEEPFAALAAAGREAQSFEQALMPLGREAERLMMVTTKGVNTHRGAIFSMGLIVAAIGRARVTCETVSPGSVRDTLQREWGEALARHAARGTASASHGAVVRRMTGRDGARQEAARAFPSVFLIGVPAYLAAGRAGLNANACHVQTLFALMEAMEDTTALYRGGLEGAAFVRRSAASFLAEGGCFRPGWREAAEGLHRAFVDRNLSAGGCADLLAVTILIAKSCGLG